MRHTFLVVTVKRWLKSVYIYGSYGKIKTGVPLFWTTGYITFSHWLFYRSIDRLIERLLYCFAYKELPNQFSWSQVVYVLLHHSTLKTIYISSQFRESRFYSCVIVFSDNNLVNFCLLTDGDLNVIIYYEMTVSQDF